MSAVEGSRQQEPPPFEEQQGTEEQPQQEGELQLAALPAVAVDLILQHLLAADRAALRSSCKAGAALVDARTDSLVFTVVCRLRPGLASRFPAARRMLLNGICNSNSWHTAAQLFSVLFQAEQWPSLKDLYLRWVPADAALQAISACPNMEVCTLIPHSLSDCSSSYHVPVLRAIAQSDRRRVPEVLRSLCSLPSLTTLTINNHELGAAELRALAGSSSLATLDVQLGPCGAEEWAALLALRVRSLTISVPGSQEDLPRDLSTGLTALTALKLATHGDVPLEMETAQLSMLLPPSLVELSLRRQGGLLPKQPLPVQSGGMLVPALPNLASLELDGSLIGGYELFQLGQACPSLATLKVEHLALDSSCARRPLRSIKELSVMWSLDIRGPVRLPAVFPGLISLSLTCDCDCEGNDGYAIEGALQLERLDIGFARYYDGPAGYLRLWTIPEVVAFQALSSLKELRLNVSESHIIAVQPLVRLECITWICGRHIDDDDFDGVADTFCSMHPPSQLSVATFDFVEVAGVPGISNSLEWLTTEQPAIQAFIAGQGLKDVAAAAQAWLLQSETLRRVVWHADDAHCAAVTDVSLYALAAHPSIEHIELHNCCVSNDMLERVQRMHGSRGLKVHIHD